MTAWSKADNVVGMPSANITADTEDALALKFVSDYGASFRWTPGLEWMHDAGPVWERDDKLKRFDCMRAIVRAAAGRSADSDRKRLESNKTVNGAAQLARSDPRIVLPADSWDADPFVLNTPGGVVDLRTGQLRQRTTTDYFTQCAQTTPDGDTGCPIWLRFLDDVFTHDAEMIEFVQRLSGYCLTGDRREQKIFFAHGVGSNGKSTFFDLLAWIMGSYALKLPPGVLMQQRNENHPTELAQLRGKRFAISSELEEGSFWAESRIKELTGDEKLSARFMRGDFFEFQMTQKHLVVGNYKPRLRGGDAALARRFVLIPFRAKFEGERRDAALPQKLRSEAPGILAWAIDGAAKWYESGLVIPASVTGASAEYMQSNDDVLEWIDECCERRGDCENKAGDLYESFASWLKARGQHACSMRVWADRLAVVQGIEKRRSGGIKYRGIRLTEAENARLANMRM